MKEKISRKVGIVLLATLLLVVGCTSSVKQRREESSQPDLRGAGKYYHFDDVLVPGELNYQQKRSFVYETSRFKAGVLTFSKWRVETSSLIEYFTYHMEKDNWKLVNSFRGAESFLNFSKPDKTCTIRIIENWHGTTEVEIRVGPIGEKKI
jgi:hypothetical protein